MRGASSVFVYLTNPAAVKDAIAECQRMGRNKFLEHYGGFQHSKKYTLLCGGEEFDSKAIAAVAYRYQYPHEPPLTPKSNCRGGKNSGQAGWALARLGFTVRGIRENGGQDYEAEEGYTQDQTKLFRSRNKSMIAKRKKLDNYMCQSCNFRVSLDGISFIIDCHHKYPLYEGERVTTVNDLVCLCPTCHRIAHSRKYPLSVKEIQATRQAARLAGFNI